MNNLKCPESKSLSHCLTELIPIYQINIGPSDGRKIIPTTHGLTLLSDLLCHFYSLQLFNWKFPKVSENERTVEYVGENGAKFLPTNIMHLTFYADGIRLDEGRFRSGIYILNFLSILSNFLSPKKQTHNKKKFKTQKPDLNLPSSSRIPSA